MKRGEGSDRNLRTLRDERNKALEAEKLATEAHLKMLQQQINPHFLFNSLNSLRSLITIDTDKARDMVTDISSFLRKALLASGNAEISVEEEVIMLKTLSIDTANKIRNRP